MAGIQVYDDLLTAVTNWLDGASTASQVSYDGPTMVQLAEADFRRNINSTALLVSTTMSAQAPTLPADFDSVRSLSISSSYTAPLSNAQEIQALPLGAFNDLDGQITGQPIYYTLTNGALQLWPTADQAYTINLVYVRNLPPLSEAAPSNWLLAAHPDAYLFGTLLQASFFGWEDERLPLIQQKLSAIIDDINADEQRKRYGSGPLIMRPSVQERPYVRQYASGGIGYIAPPITTEQDGYLQDG